MNRPSNPLDVREPGYVPQKLSQFVEEMRERENEDQARAIRRDNIKATGDVALKAFLGLVAVLLVIGFFSLMGRNESWADKETAYMGARP